MENWLSIQVKNKRKFSADELTVAGPSKANNMVESGAKEFSGKT